MRTTGCCISVADEVLKAIRISHVSVNGGITHYKYEYEPVVEAVQERQIVERGLGSKTSWHGTGHRVYSSHVSNSHFCSTFCKVDLDKIIEIPRCFLHHYSETLNLKIIG